MYKTFTMLFEWLPSLEWPPFIETWVLDECHRHVSALIYFRTPSNSDTVSKYNFDVIFTSLLEAPTCNQSIFLEKPSIHPWILKPQYFNLSYSSMCYKKLEPALLCVCVCVCVFVCLCVCVCVCVCVRPSMVKASSVWIRWDIREQINDIMLKTLISYAKSLHRYLRMQHLTFLPSHIILFIH